MTIGPELVSAPDFTEAVVGYRQFVLAAVSQHNYALTSAHTSEVWTKPKMTARCVAEVKVPEGIALPGPLQPHSAPQKNCSCGIYAYMKPCPVYEPSMADFRWIADHHRDKHVAALVALSGRIEVHATGMRAQYATICALGDNRNLSDYERLALAQIAESWGVPLVAQRDLPALAPEYGRPLAPEDEPEPEPEVPAPPRGYVTPPPYVPSLAPAAINAFCALSNIGLWVVWDKPLNLLACAFSTGFAGYYVGRRREARTRALASNVRQGADHAPA